MKKALFAGLFLAISAIVTPVIAGESIGSGHFYFTLPQHDSWSFLQLGFFPQFPSYTHDSEVNGMKYGLPMCGGIGLVRGTEISFFYSGTEYIDGFQASAICDDAKYMRGMQAAPCVNLCTRIGVGMQAALVNVANEMLGFQASGFGIANRIDGYQATMLGSIAREVNGCQTGLFCIADKLHGTQFSVTLNSAKDADWGFQAGLVNVINGKKGIQFGLINVISDGWVPFLPFFNISL